MIQAIDLSPNITAPPVYSGPYEVLVNKPVTLKGSYAYSRRDFADALALLARVPINTSWLERMPLRDGKAAFDALAHETTPAIKILLQPNGVTD